ncbi:MAG: hypothetical protein ACLPQ6_03300 [Steroidobacteraceae bacterium]
MVRSIGPALALAALLLTGCASLEPDAVRVEAVHESFALQHIADHATDYGTNEVAIAAHWQRGQWVGELSEGYVFNGGCVNCPSKDLFRATVGYNLWVRP